MIALGWVVNLFQRGAASMGRLNVVLETRSTIPVPKDAAPTDALRGDIEFRSVSFKYPDTDRMVPKRKADSGMMLFVVPAVIWAMVTTAGSKTSTRRVTIDWSASTISAAIAMGSTALCGIDAWPPRPRTVIRMTSVAAISGPGLRWISPVG